MAGDVERWPEDAGLEYGQDANSQNHAGCNSVLADFQTFLFILLPKSSTLWPHSLSPSSLPLTADSPALNSMEMSHQDHCDFLLAKHDVVFVLFFFSLVLVLSDLKQYLTMLITCLPGTCPHLLSLPTCLFARFSGRP